jgi:PHD/YefM family antitoxin component YafN of YafNO toxin-antitoxin module
METPKPITKHEQFIAGKNGKVQYVIVPAEEYQILSDIIEDYGLGLAMKKAMKDKMYSREEALRILGDD